MGRRKPAHSISGDCMALSPKKLKQSIASVKSLCTIVDAYLLAGNSAFPVAHFNPGVVLELIQAYKEVGWTVELLQDMRFGPYLYFSE